MTVPELFFVSEKPAAELAGADNVLFLGNALGTDTHLWDLALPTLAAKYSVVRFDMPGHGQSPVPADSFTLEEIADAIVARADAWGIEKFDFAGVSVSGGIALELAAKFPNRVKHSIPVCSAAYMGGPANWSDRISQVREHGTASVVPSLPGRWFSEGFVRQDSGAVEKLLTMVARTDPHSYILTCEALAEFDIREQLAQISIPVLVISGEIDPGTTPEAGALIAQGIPSGRQVIIPGASHQSVVEKPLEVAKAIVTFLDN